MRGFFSKLEEYWGGLKDSWPERGFSEGLTDRGARQALARCHPLPAGAICVSFLSRSRAGLSCVKAFVLWINPLVSIS